MWYTPYGSLPAYLNKLFAYKVEDVSLVAQALGHSVGECDATKVHLAMEHLVFMGSFALPAMWSTPGSPLRNLSAARSANSIVHRAPVEPGVAIHEATSVDTTGPAFAIGNDTEAQII